MGSDLLRLLRTRWLWLALLTACLPGASWAVAATGQAVIRSVGSSVQGDTQVIRIDFSEALVATPSSFLIDSPTRIAIDVRGASNGTGKRTFDLRGGLARTLRIASAPDRARLVIALNQSASYRTEVTGQTLTVFIQEVAAPQGDASAKADEPGQRYLLLVEERLAPIHPRQLAKDLRDLRFEAHVEHAIGLVQYDVAAVL